MDDRGLQFRVGILVVATLIIAAILIQRFGDLPGIQRDQYTIYVRFPQAPGVTVDTPVHKSGILIGRVSRVTLLDDGGVVVTAKIDSNRQLKNNETCRISTGTILGDAVLEFVPSSADRPTLEVYSDGEYLDGVVAQDPLRVMESATDVLEMLSTLEEDVRLALVSIEGAGRQIGNVAESMTAIIDNNQDQLRRVLGKAESAMDRFDETMGTIGELSDVILQVVDNEDLNTALEQTVVQVPELLKDARTGVQSFRQAADRASRNLRNLEGLTEPLGERGEVFATTIEDSLDEIETIVQQVAAFSQSINNQDGTVGKLLNDREMYDRINNAVARIDATVSNIEHLSRRVRPIIEDARVFTDKIARDPGRLGVKGALDRRQSGTKR